MNVLTELNTLFSSLELPVETGIFSGVPPNEYMVLTPLVDSFAVHSDNKPHFDIQEVRLSLFSKKNYIKRKNQLVRLLLQADFVITDRRYIGYENDSGFFSYTIDCSKCYDITPQYEMEEI